MLTVTQLQGRLRHRHSYLKPFLAIGWLQMQHKKKNELVSDWLNSNHVMWVTRSRGTHRKHWCPMATLSSVCHKDKRMSSWWFESFCLSIAVRVVASVAQPVLTWLLWMEMAQASLSGSCCRLMWIPPPDLNTQRSGFSTSVTPHRKRTRGSPEATGDESVHGWTEIYHHHYWKDIICGILKKYDILFLSDLPIQHERP